MLGWNRHVRHRDGGSSWMLGTVVTTRFSARDRLFLSALDSKQFHHLVPLYHGHRGYRQGAGAGSSAHWLLRRLLTYHICDRPYNDRPFATRIDGQRSPCCVCPSNCMSSSCPIFLPWTGCVSASSVRPWPLPCAFGRMSTSTCPPSTWMRTNEKIFWHASVEDGWIGENTTFVAHASS